MKALLLGAAALLSSYQVVGQAATPQDYSLLASAVQAARQRYLSNAPESRLINGVAYGNTAPSYVTGQPFYLANKPQSGRLEYDGQSFEGVLLQYEQVQDQVLYYSAEKADPIQLIRQQVSSFEVAGHHFVYLPSDKASGLSDGFYDLVVAGPAQLLVKRAKKLEATTGGYGLKGEYEEVNRYFIRRQEHFYEVTTLKQALAALADKKLEIQAYARDNRLRLTTDSRELALSKLVQQYNALIKD
jgi:hypothetical protein